MKFSIYYPDAVITGDGEEEWRAAPDNDVQVVVVHKKHLKRRPSRKTTGFVYDGDETRRIYTGVDKYDPMKYGMKYGSLIPDDQYEKIYADAGS